MSARRSGAPTTSSLRSSWSASTLVQLGRSYRGKLIVRATPNPNFRRVEAQISDEGGLPVLTLSTVLWRFG